MQCRPRPPLRSPTSRANPISCRYNGVQDLALEVPVLGVLVQDPAPGVLVRGPALGVLVRGLAPGVLVRGLARPGVRVRVPARGGLYRVRPEAPAGIIQDVAFAYSQRRVEAAALHQVGVILLT